MSNNEDKKSEITVSSQANSGDEVPMADLSLKDITSGENERGIPATKFIEDIDSFANSFDPPATAELLIGAFSDLFSKYKQYENRLTQKRLNFQTKIPEIEKVFILLISFVVDMLSISYSGNVL